MNRHGLSYQAIVNVDETRIKINFDSVKTKTLNTTKRKKHSKKEQRSSSFSSYIPFVTSVGEIILDIFVIPIKPNVPTKIFLEQVNPRSRGSHPTYYTFSPTGCIDTELWLEILKKFKSNWELIHPGLHPVVLTDNLAAHKAADAISYLKATTSTVSFFLLTPLIS